MKVEDVATEREADILLVEFRRQWTFPFCPLIKDYCRADCVCFMPADRFKMQRSFTEGMRWRVREACCGNDMFNMPIPD